MSTIPFGASIAAAAAENLLGLIIVRQRNIGGFVADVTVREKHSDTLEVTDNPVEQGAAITDHAFKRPAELTVVVGYSNSSINAAADPNYVQEQYQNFLALQASRQPFDVITGKRMYSNMMMTYLETETTQETENATILTVEMREVILVATQTISVPNASVMQNPSINGATQSLGFNQLVPANNYNSSASPAK